jgi:hypothetical protein
VIAQIRSSGGKMNALALPEMREYWRRIGYEVRPRSGSKGATRRRGQVWQHGRGLRERGRAARSMRAAWSLAWEMRQGGQGQREARAAWSLAWKTREGGEGQRGAAWSWTSGQALSLSPLRASATPRSSATAALSPPCASRGGGPCIVANFSRATTS